ncbi:metallophosphoesterase [Aquimarina sp. ERC-38]|uniref:metallophosphoesterase family protein n=1 Tax=Aquimarina sp. ERC-38 TaxID=2949996 RepID=UPI0022463ECD|nr:metallophosphoesterase [Aquimarina sp. ERC-38]UZO81318.1 metallophosphoesterase [Aquimarina sp. ERC-38]
MISLLKLVCQCLLSLIILSFYACKDSNQKLAISSSEPIIKNISEPESWKFVAFGDCRGHSSEDPVNVPVLQKLVAEIIKQEVDLVMFTGDICYGHANRKELGDQGALEDLKRQMLLFRKTIDPLYKKGIKVYIVRGNHEATQRYPDVAGTADHRPIWPETKKVWDNVFGDSYQMPQNGPDGEKNLTFFDTHKNALIIGLDLYTARDDKVNADGSIPKPSTKRIHQKWLDSILAIHDKPHVFAFTHEPAFKVDHQDCMHGDTSYKLDYSKYRDQFWQSLQEAGAKAYFCGHDHGYALAAVTDTINTKKDTIYQVVVGTAGAGKSIAPVYDGYNTHHRVTPINTSKSYGFVLGEVTGTTARIFYRYLDEQENFQNQKPIELIK